MSERDEVQDRVQLHAAYRGNWLLRNNSGALKRPDGTGFIRFGLGNVSKNWNDNCKSSDLIGIEWVLITQEMVGTYIGRFKARECKLPGWHYSGDEREKAQLRFINKVNQLGGDAAFTTGPGIDVIPVDKDL
jgi:hypothetical protein